MKFVTNFFVCLMLAVTFGLSMSQNLLAQPTTGQGATRRVPENLICGFRILEGFGAKKLENNKQAREIIDKVLQTSNVNPKNVNLSPSNQVISSIAIACENEESNGAFRRFILYDPDELNRLSQEVGSDWFITAIFAHEVGHIRLNHSILLRKPADCDNVLSADVENGILRKEMEAAADEFAGKVLAKLGATLEQAQAAFAKISEDVGDDCYPSRAERLFAIKKGWEEIKGPANPKEVQGFNFFYQFGDDPGTHIWTKVDSNTWTERFPRGEADKIEEIGRITVEGDIGTLLRHKTKRELEYFIPDKGGKIMWLRIRASGGEWSFLGEMKNIR